MTYTSMDVANYVVGYCTKHSTSITNLKLQKILYFLWVDYCKHTGEYLYRDEIYAWQLGPVVPEVYYEFCAYAGLPIRLTPPTTIKEDSDMLLNQLIKKYDAFSVGKLVNLTHEPGKPWDRIYQNGEGNRRKIPFRLIQQLECGARED